MRVVKGIFKLDVDEPVVELCEDCAPPPKPGAPPAQTQANKLHRCSNVNCGGPSSGGRYWIFGQFTDTFRSETELDEWLCEMNREHQLEKAQ